MHTGHMEGVFAATPPVAANTCLLSIAMTEGISYKRGQMQQGMRLDFIDVRRAYFCAAVARSICVETPEEGREEGTVGHLRQSMSGTRGAAPNWGMSTSTL